MGARIGLCTLIGGALLLVPAAQALANTIAPIIFVTIPSYWPFRIPESLPLSLLASLPASVLTAFLERPFLTAGGLRTHTLWYSLQANFISLLAGFLLLPVLLPLVILLNVLVIPIPIFITICIERWYYRVRRPDGATISTGWVAWANIFSSVVLLLLEPLAERVKQAWPMLVGIVRPYQATLIWIGAIGGAVLFIFSFVIPWRGAAAPEAAKEAGALPAAVPVAGQAACEGGTAAPGKADQTA